MTSVLSAEANAITLCAEAAMLAEGGDSLNAIERYRQAVDMAPQLLALHIILANAQQIEGDILGARATLRRAVRVAARPDAETEFTLGKALVDAGAGADAVSCFRRVRAEHPDDASAASALAAALRDAQQPEEAWSEIRNALRMAPDDPVALLTAALIRHDLTDYRGALGWCNRSLAVRPDSPGARVTRGYLHHLLGNADAGWKDFESRPLPKPNTSAQPWRGDALDGKSLLVMGEQGVGDQFQFLRFLRHPKVQRASRVIIACQSDAVALLRAAGYDAIARDDVLPATDRYVPLLSLPLLLQVGAEWRGAGDAYIPLPDVATRPRSRTRRIGVVWAGNPAHRNDAVRSIPASVIASLVPTHRDVQFVCMQHGVSAADLPSASWEQPVCGDWLETARQLCTLDLLITVDTGIAHLAGALGLPVWILLPFVPDWRWSARGSATVWYPAARLFRQPARGQWARVITNVSAALSAFEIRADS